MRRLIQYSLYPATMAASVYSAYLMLYIHQLPLYSIMAPLTAAFVLVGIMERVMPYRAKWNTPQEDLVTDATYIGINLALREAANVGFKLALIAALASIGFNNASLNIWPTEWHPLFQLVLALLALDFFEYWFHRSSHKFGFLWRFHAIHHSPKRLYFFNAARFHFVDWLALAAIDVIVIMALGADVTLVALAVVFIQTHGLFQHGNVDVKLGFLNYLLSGPELHRWHHSKLIEESDTNFGNNVIVWDLLFGTWFLPKDRQVGVLGLFNPDYPTSFWGQLKAAFAPTRVDKPADFYEKEPEYLAQLEQDNIAEEIALRQAQS